MENENKLDTGMRDSKLRNQRGYPPYPDVINSIKTTSSERFIIYILYSIGFYFVFLDIYIPRFSIWELVSILVDNFS